MVCMCVCVVHALKVQLLKNDICKQHHEEYNPSHIFYTTFLLCLPADSLSPSYITYKSTYSISCDSLALGFRPAPAKNCRKCLGRSGAGSLGVVETTWAETRKLQTEMCRNPEKGKACPGLYEINQLQCGKIESMLEVIQLAGGQIKS